jgi:hypothetical protein
LPFFWTNQNVSVLETRKRTALPPLILLSRLVDSPQFGGFTIREPHSTWGTILGGDEVCLLYMSPFDLADLE